MSLCSVRQPLAANRTLTWSSAVPRQHAARRVVTASAAERQGMRKGAVQLVGALAAAQLVMAPLTAGIALADVASQAADAVQSAAEQVQSSAPRLPDIGQKLQDALPGDVFFGRSKQENRGPDAVGADVRDSIARASRGTDNEAEFLADKLNKISAGAAGGGGATSPEQRTPTKLGLTDGGL